MKLIALTLLIFVCAAQNRANLKANYHLPMNYDICNSSGCTDTKGAVNLDENWRWLHYVKSSESCQSGSNWDKKFCPDARTCADNCGYEGIPQEEYESKYGVKQVNRGIQMKYITGSGVGQRLYFMENEDKYKIFSLFNREFAYDVDTSTLECGMNGALYFVSMEADGGASKYPGNKAGASYGSGYCDANCAREKFIYGQANSNEWGNHGSCCNEFDFWEANKEATVMTAHPCKVPGYYRCTGNECGDGDQRYSGGVCDMDGCGLNPYQIGNKSFYGYGSTFSVDTSKPFTVLTQFITNDGTDSGDLSEIKRFYIQNGKKVQSPKGTWPGFGSQSSLSNAFCSNEMKAFSTNDRFFTVGGMKIMGAALKKGMVLTLSLWDDYSSHMKWMDGVFPPGYDPSKPGIARGPCTPESGNPDDLRKRYPNAFLGISNVKYGTIGSTVKLSSETQNSLLVE